MIIGHGDIGSVLKDREGFIFFASGVSNSKEIRESEYTRERRLLLSQDPMKHIVYFSTLSVFYGTSRYIMHKMEMERIVKTTFRHYTIVRLGNITWGDNPNTFINNMKNKVKHHQTFNIFDEYRYIITLPEFLHWVDLIPEWNCEMNITGQRMKVKDVMKEYVYE